MNFIVHKNFGDDNKSSSVTSHTSYKKKVKDPRKGKQFQNDHAGRGHAPGCDCDMCGDFPVRTHMLLDMSSNYSRLDGNSGRNQGVIAMVYNFLFRKKSAMNQNREDYRPPPRVKFNNDDYDDKHAGPLEPVNISNLKQDCFIIPISKLHRFFPAGHPIPKGDAYRLRMVETCEPDVHVMFHVMGPAVPFIPSLDSPLIDMKTFQQQTITKAFKATVAQMNLGASLQGMVLSNLEKGGEIGPAEYPYMIVWVIDSKKCDIKVIGNKIKQVSLDHLDPSKTGYSCDQYIDTFEEVASVARPPLEKLSRKASTPGTGYIISVFKVFEGDDGVKFERNWLGWSGARAIYSSIYNDDVGLRRITLHKSSAFKGLLTYILLCDCSNFLMHLTNAVKAVPRLRMRLCGETGLYRPVYTV